MIIDPPSWFLWPLGDDMDRLNAYVFFRLGSLLRDCVENSRRPLKLWSTAAENAQRTLARIMDEPKGFKLEESRAAATPLSLALLNAHVDFLANGDIALTEDKANELSEKFARFENALSLELGRAPIFFVTPKGIYETERLIDRADSVYEGYSDRLPSDAVDDTRQAGRCLAFSLPTAAGFHIARAVESVIKKYMTAYGCPEVKESARNWGNYIKRLEAKAVDARITHHLTQIKDLHRNPMTHPDQTLTMPEAQSLWAMGISVIQVMVGDMERKQANPDPVIAAMLPPVIQDDAVSQSPPSGQQ
jgi:hypothetical protein